MSGVLPAHALWLLPAAPAGAGAVLLLTGRRLPGRGAPLAVLGAAVALGLAVALPHGAAPVVASRVLVDGAGVTVGSYVDGLSWLLAVTVGTVALAVQVYSVAYLRGDTRYSSYAGLVSVFTAAMLLVVSAADLLELLIGWEVMGVCSYLLIAHHWEQETSVRAAVQAFLTTRLADLAFTAGFITLGVAAHSFAVPVVLHAPLGAGTRTAALLLVVVGCLGKSAQVPFQTWLPDAMAGPTPVSALIHAATMVAAGVFVVGRLYPVLRHDRAALDTLALAAAVTMLFGALCALAQDDLKRVLAWSTVSQLAYMYGGLAVGGYAAGVAHLLSHAAFKALLFLAAGSVSVAAGTTLTSGMGGLRRRLPVTAGLAAVGFAALAGLPPTAGYLTKDAVLDSAWQAARGNGPVPVDRPVAWLLWASAVLTAAVTAGYALRTWLRVFAGPAAQSADVAAVPAASGATLDPDHVPSLGAGHPAAGPRHAPLSRGDTRLLGAPVAVLAVLSVGLLGLLAGGRSVLAGPLRSAAGGAVGLDLGLSGTQTLVTLLPAVAVGGVVLVAWAGGRRDPAAVLLRAARPWFLRGAGVDALYRRWIAAPVGGVVARAVSAADSRLVDGAVEGGARLTGASGVVLRRLQNGNPQRYATAVAVGVVGAAVAVSLAVQAGGR